MVAKAAEMDLGPGEETGDMTFLMGQPTTFVALLQAYI